MRKIKLLFAAISLILIISMLCVPMAFVGATAADDAAVKLSVNAGNGKVKVEVNGSEVHNGAGTYTADVAKGASVTLTAVVGEGEGILMFWADKYGYTVSNEDTYTFTANSDTSITAYFETVGKSTIVYRNNTDARKVLTVVARDVDSLLEEHLVKDAYKYGHTFNGWDLTVTNINDGIKAGKGAIYVDPYYEVSADKCEINVVGGKVNGSTSASVSMFTDITLTPDNKDTFVAWKDGDGNIISDKAELSVKAFKSETYTVVTAKIELAPTATLYLTPDENQVVHARTLVFAPAGTTVVSYGLLYVKNTDYTTTDMKVENVGNDNILKMASYEDPTGVLVNRFVDTDYVVARAYLTYTDGNTTATVYSSATEMHSIEDDYWVGSDGKGDIFMPDSSVGTQAGDDTAKDGFSAIHAAAGLNVAAADSYKGTNGSVIKTYKGVTASTIASLRQAYLDNGYKLYSSATMGYITSATYTRGSDLAHLYWKGTEWLKVVTSDREGTGLPTNVPTGTKAVQVIQLTGQYAYSSIQSTYTSVYETAKDKVTTAADNTSGNGMGYIIKLSDGSFIIYDGGYFADAAEVASIIGSGTVRAWVITHGHGDHTGAFLEYIYGAKNGGVKTVVNSTTTTYACNAVIERIIVAPTVTGSSDNTLSINKTMKGVVGEAQAAGIGVCYAHTGMVLDFGSVSMEILYTYEDLYMDKGDPQNWHAVYTGTCTCGKCVGDAVDESGNETSLISRVKATTGNKLSVIFLADAGHAACDRALEYYNVNNFLKSNYCQMSHHSCDNASYAIYDAVALSNYGTKWFCPSSLALYNSNKNSRNSTVLNYLYDTYRAGWNANGYNGVYFLPRNNSISVSSNPSWNTQTIG